MIGRRGFFGALAGLIAAPAIVRVESLMKLAPTRLLVPELADFSTDRLIVKTIEHYAHGWSDWRAMRAILEPGLNAAFAEAYPVDPKQLQQVLNGLEGPRSLVAWSGDWRDM